MDFKTAATLTNEHLIKATASLIKVGDTMYNKTTTITQILEQKQQHNGDIDNYNE